MPAFSATPFATLATVGHEEHSQGRFTSLVEQEEEFYRWQEEKTRLIVRLLSTLAPSGALADVGCFTGAATARYMATGFSRAVGFDANQLALAKLPARNLEPRVWKAGYEACPAQDNEFSAVVAADIIEHILDTDWFLRELSRVSQPGGHIIITTPNLLFWLSRIRVLVGKLPWSYAGVSPSVRGETMVDLNHIRISSPAEWSNLFESNLLRVEKIQGWSIFPAIGGNLLRRSIDRVLTRDHRLAFGLLFLLRNQKSS